MTDEATARIREMAEQNRQAVDLARLLSCAVPIEPALMRAMRIELLPNADVSAEADLWFGPLVQTRSRDGIMLFPDVAETLRADLNGKLAERCWHVTERLHDYLPPAVQLEERLNFLSIDPVGNAEEIGKLLQTALTALVGGARDEVANWAGRALPRLSLAVRATESASMLAVASDLRLGRGFTLAEHLSGGAIPDWFAAVLPAGLGTAALGVSATSLGLTIYPAPGPEALHIMLPATDPRVVQISAGGEKKVVFIDAKGTAQHVPIGFDAWPIELTTLAGEAFTVDRIGSPGASPDRTLACVAYANCNQALIVWQIGAPIERCLGFAIERIDADGGTEYVKNAIGFVRARPPFEPQVSTHSPIQRFNWIDRPPRGAGKIYSYRITPVVGVPSKLELVKEREAVAGPVEVGVTRQGPITALFNREPSTARSRVQTDKARSESAALEEPGGEVRRALLDLLHEALVDEVSTVYVALSRLDDPELIGAVARLGRRANVILGEVRLAGDTGQHTSVRKALSRTQLYRRGKAQGYAHSHFMVVCRRDGRPRIVWTGSMSWTVGSLYNRDGNALIIDDPAIAACYFNQWKKLSADPTGIALTTANAMPAAFTIADDLQVTPWFAPQRKGAELDAVRAELAKAHTAILFALGPRGRSNFIFEDILMRSRALFVAGIARSTDGTRMSLHQHGNEVVVTPERPHGDALDGAGIKRGSFGLPAGSRLIVIDPFGHSPVVITGSHSLSDGSSRKNDEDLLIIRGNRALAAQCAVHIQGLISHYAFLARMRATKLTFPSELRANDGWQKPFMTGERAKETRFWMATLSGYTAVSYADETPDVATRRKKRASAKRTKVKKPRTRKVSKKAATAKARVRKPPTKKASKKAATKKARSSAKSRSGSSSVVSRKKSKATPRVAKKSRVSSSRKAVRRKVKK
jgi:hypothetical protein